MRRILALAASAALVVSCSGSTSPAEQALLDLEDAAGVEFSNLRDETDQVCPDIGCSSAALSDQVEITEWPDGTDLTEQYDELYSDSLGVQRYPFIMHVNDSDWSGEPNYPVLMNDIASQHN